MPNASLTPGAVAETGSRVVCAFGYAREHRKVLYAERDAAYREYGIPRGRRKASPPRGYRIDHRLYVRVVSTSSRAQRGWTSRR
jgi:hypothetical protein